MQLRRGVVAVYFSTITIIREVQVKLSTRLQSYNKHAAPLKHDRLQSHKSAIHHQKHFPRRQLYILLNFPSHSMHYSYSQLYYYYYEGSTFEQKLKVSSYIYLQLSSRGFKYILLWYLATVQVFSCYNNRKITITSMTMR